MEDVCQLSLAALLREADLVDVAQRVSLAEPVDALVSALEVGSAFSDFYQQLGERRREIALRRTFADDPVILEALAEDFGVTRERVRQLEVSVKKRFKGIAGARYLSTALHLRRSLHAVVPDDRFRRLLTRLTNDAGPELREAATTALLQHIHYSRFSHGWGSRDFWEEVEELSDAVGDFADEYGIVDEQGLRNTLGVEDDQLWRQLLAAAEVPKFRGRAVIRDTRAARALIVLQELGEPTTREDLADLTEFDVRSIASVLSSEDTFVRISKDTWGLRGWTDDPYDGVVAEIVQRIEEDGGKTNVNRLLHEIPARFGVSIATVRAYLATPQFRLSGDIVEIADPEPVDSKPLTSLSQIVWTADGTPTLRLTVQESHLKGYSFKIPPAVALHLGVGIGDSIELPVLNPEGCQDISVIWRAYDPNGPEIGRLKDALVASDTTPGMEAFIILRPKGIVVSQDADGLQASPPARGGSGAGRPTIPASTTALIEKMKARRKL